MNKMWFLKLPKAAAAIGVVVPLGAYFTGKKSQFSQVPLRVSSYIPRMCPPVHAETKFVVKKLKSPKHKGTKKANSKKSVKSDHVKSAEPVENIAPISGPSIPNMMMKVKDLKEAKSAGPAPVPAPIKNPTVPADSCLGISIPEPSGNLISKQPDSFLTISFNRHNKMASWVIEDLSPCTLQGCCGMQKFPYREDPRVKPEFQSSRNDYTMTYGEYEMVQLASPANLASNREAVEETYLMTNIVPMDAQMKIGTWAFLENYIRCTYVAQNCNTYVITGPLWRPRSRYAGKVEHDIIGAKRIPVPTDFFKIVAFRAEDGRERYVAFVFPNEPSLILCPDDLNLFRVPLAEIDGWSGFDFSEVLQTFQEVPLCDRKVLVSPPVYSPCPPCCEVKKRPCPRPPGL